MYDRVWRMAPDNFTPPTRTPWGGRRLLDTIKSDLDLEPAKAAYAVVGESWEVSVEPSFPSRVVNLDGFEEPPTMAELVEADPVAALGPVAAEAFGGCPLLVKLLDAALPLSVQVHPSDDYERLAEDESGKPESWVIIDAQPGAGLYLGLADGVSRDDVARTLREAGDLEKLLTFVPVAPGDCFEIEPGTVHSIGAGVTLVEPQTVLPGRKGVTYRFWDWNRRYDDRGRPDPAGQPRQLHVEDSLAVTTFGGPTGSAYVDTLRRHTVPVAEHGEAVHARWIDSADFRVDRLAGRGTIELDVDRLLAAVVVEGRVLCDAGTGSETFRRGESFVLPARLSGARIQLDDALIVLSAPGC